jgi:hypothetical protein
LAVLQFELRTLSVCYIDVLPLWLIPPVHCTYLFFFFLVVLEFELGLALGRQAITWATPPALFIFVWIEQKLLCLKFSLGDLEFFIWEHEWPIWD